MLPSCFPVTAILVKRCRRYRELCQDCFIFRPGRSRDALMKKIGEPPYLAQTRSLCRHISRPGDRTSRRPPIP